MEGDRTMEWLLAVILSVAFIGEIVFILIKIPQTKIALGNVGDLWVRTPENTVLAIMKNRKLFMLIFAVSMIEEEKTKIKEKYMNEDFECVFVDSRIGGLYWIGPSFLGLEVYEWYETPEEEKDGIHALHSIDLAEQVIEYLPAEPKMVLKGKEEEEIASASDSRENVTYDPKYGVPSFKSADNVEIRTKLTIYYKVVDPKKALFDIRYRKKAIKDEIFPAWKDVLGEFSFFVYQANQLSQGLTPRQLKKLVEEDKMPKVVADIRSQSNKALRDKIGINFGDDIKVEDEKLYGSSLTKGKIAEERFLDQYGIRITDVTVGDLEAADPKIEEALGAQMRARAKALAAIEEALGKKLADEHEGAGKEKYFKQYLKGIMGEGEEKITREQAVQVLVKLENFGALKDIPPEGRVFYQWPGDNLGASPQEALKKVVESLGINLNALGDKKQ